MKLFEPITRKLDELDVTSLDEQRKAILQPLVNYMQTKLDHKQSIKLNFICTHNSRRSHLSQVWAQAIAAHFGIKGVTSYSGGTEATALFPVVAETLKQTGFDIKTLSEGENPIYSIKYARNEHAIIGFSKTFDDEFNPKSEFAAILTCSQADEGCPFIAGAEQRIPVTYEDPKLFDNTPQQTEMYQERSTQIATELLYVFSQLNLK